MGAWSFGTFTPAFRALALVCARSRRRTGSTSPEHVLAALRSPMRRFMLWSVNIGTIAGTAVRIHVTFLLFLVWILIASYMSGGAQAAWSSTAFMVLLFAC